VLKVCVVGAGAIGGFLGTRLALTGEADVAALARGTTLVALRDHGWRLESDGQQLSAPAAKAADDPRELGPQDLVIITVKAPALPRLAPTLRPLIGPETIILPAMNGVPWWFSIGLAALGGEPLASVDPHGQIAATLPLAQVLGCVVHASASQREPGVALHRMGRGLIIGEPGGGESARVRALAGLFGRADFEVSCSSNIRYDVWYKLWGNMTMNPVSALTGATMDRVLADDLLREVCSAAMREAAAIGTRIGCEVRETPEDRHAVTRKLGAFKTSMLQDVEAGRALELDALVGAVREIGARIGVATPTIDTLFALTRAFARVRGLYPH
jgi:2-dehydropantoate 2-reductase